MSKLNKYILPLCFTTVLIISLKCNDKEVIVPLTVDVNSEIQEGAWLFEKVEDNDGNVLLNGAGEPKMILFFEKDNIVKGRLKGSYSISHDSLHIIAKIDSLTPIYNAEFDKLGNFPKRYYDFEKYFKNGLNCKIRFYENGWDSKISIHMPDGRVMWMMRY